MTAAAESAFHFAQPAWLLAWGIIPLVVIWLRRTRSVSAEGQLERYADAALIPHLVSKVPPTQDKRRWWKGFVWPLLWALVVLALAGPRWDYSLQRLYRPGVDLLLLVDISRSMDATDVAPTRLARARQEAQDLLDNASGMRIGLILFASVAHVAVPLTEDHETIKRLLPEISTDLVRLKGSRLSVALDRAERLLAGSAADTVRAVLVITDGDFEEPRLMEHVRRLAATGIQLHVLALGSAGGAHVPVSAQSALIDAVGRPVYTRLNERVLQRLADVGGGVYLPASYRGDDTREIVKAITERASIEQTDARAYRVWHERFYLALVPALLGLLPWFRRRVRLA